ncbi:hypothetical protein [Micromonospora sp. NBC_01638]|uniref:hypothetical protein n=1 Tax=Micromonospora sp. NBC_01638 TaxID=2975982 RepID=UPI003869115D|nr:hypothetical protein OG811_28675 [Micromonospora sp. NBC_01638]
MGVNVELRRQGAAPRRGRVPTTTVDIVIDAHDVFVALLNKYYKSGQNPTLDRIDPYASTTLHGADIRKLIKELSVITHSAVSDAEKHQLTRITALAEKCSAQGQDHQLHFVGD